MIEGLQQANISLNKGIVRTPSLGAEGELSECVNLIPHAGEMVRIKEPQPIGLELLEGEILLATNRCAGKENFIVQKGNELAYYRPEGGRHVIATIENGEVSVDVLGYTLIVTQGTTKRYFLWGENETYKEQNFMGVIPKAEITLGNCLFNPYLGSSFLTFHTTLYKGEISIQNVKGGKKLRALKGNTLELSQRLWGDYNIMRDTFKSGGAHCFPFYIRWGIQLYDDSIINLSAPILMLPTPILRPFLSIDIAVGTPGDPFASTSDLEFTINLVPRRLYAAFDASAMTDIDPSLIKGIAIFATPEIEVVDIESDPWEKGFDMTYYHEGAADAFGWRNTYRNLDVQYVFNYSANLPVKDDLKPAVEAFNDPTDFYLLSFIPWEIILENNGKVFSCLTDEPLPNVPFGETELWPSADTAYQDIVDQGFYPHVSRVNLKALTSQTSLASFVVEQSNYVVSKANTTYAYNSRLFYGGVNLTRPLECDVSQFFADSGYNTSDSEESFSAYLRISGANLTMTNSNNILKGYRGLTPVVILPYPEATGLCLKLKKGDVESWGSVIGLQKKKGLLGEYAIYSNISEASLRSITDLGELFLPSVENIEDTWESNNYTKLSNRTYMPNGVAVTKVANPWVIEAVYELACGEIYALTSATEALSEGQFGEFPIYAFTDNGIYALSIDRDGTIEAKQPISRDVLLEMNSTLQIDKAVIYPTKEGLKLISGRNTSLLSASIAGLNVQESGFSTPLELTIADGAPFQEQLEGIKMVYDYAHRQVHLFGKEVTSEGKQKHYVYDLESGQWATQILDKQLTTCVAGYPFSTMQFGKQLMQYTDALEVNVVKQGWLLTRPISFSDPFTRKMLADIRVLGQKTNTDTKFKVQVYISEDRVKWHRLTSLKGRSAKWYRFLIMADMCGLDTLTGITCQYVPRLGNKLR